VVVDINNIVGESFNDSSTMVVNATESDDVLVLVLVVEVEVDTGMIMDSEIVVGGVVDGAGMPTTVGVYMPHSHKTGAIGHFSVFDSCAELCRSTQVVEFVDLKLPGTSPVN
jgi:hypothetical protein